MARGPDTGTWPRSAEETPTFKIILVPTSGSQLARRAAPLTVECAKLQQPGIGGIPALPADRMLISCEGALDRVTEGRIEGEAKDRVEKFLALASSGAWSAGMPREIVSNSGDYR